MNTDPQTLIFGLIGGIIPALFWLWFWLRQDKKRPEPRGLIFLSFIGGMLIVPLVIPIQKMVITSFAALSFFTILILAAIEEILKYLSSYIFALRNKAMDEAIDPMIYLITIALGFAALENSLFLFNTISNGTVLESFITGNMRFVGATLLHTVSSATIGVAMALTFFKRKKIKRIALLIGIILAISLHALFNFFIINVENGQIFWVFVGVWILVVFLIMFFERLKRTRKNIELIKKSSDVK
jgi:protease PrsW